MRLCRIEYRIIVQLEEAITVMEIARENGIPHEEAVTRFLSDVELQYNNKLGFQSKIDSLRSEVSRLRVELLFLPSVGVLCLV